MDINPLDLVEQLSQENIELWFEGNRLRFRAPSGKLSTEQRSSLAENKEAVLEILRQQATTTVKEYPLSYGQQSLWFINQSDPESAAYNVAWTGRICTAVNVSMLQNAFQALVDRHAALRTTYPAVRGVATQRVVGYSPVCFFETDASAWSKEELYKSVRAAYLEPFDLKEGPLLRASLFSRADKEHILLIVVHHIAVDGWSLWILLDELRTLLAASAHNKPANLPRPPALYADFVTWQNDLLDGPQGETLQTYWQQQLAGELPVLSIPTDRPRPQIQSLNGASYNFMLDETLASNLKALAKTEEVTLYMVLLAAFEILLHRYASQDELIIGSPTFGRSKAEYAKVVGDFINMLALRIDFSGNPSFKDFLAKVRKTVLEGLQHQEYPFPRLVADLSGHRDASRSPVFQVTFDVQRLHSFGELAQLFIPGKSGRVVDFGGFAIEAYPMPQQEGQFDLGLLMLEVEDAIPATLKYNTDLFDEISIQRMIEHFKKLLEGIVANPLARIGEFSLLSDEEYQRLVFEWNQTQSEYPRNRCTYELFEAQVERTPEALAVISGDQKLTYQQLNWRANQLAHYLRTLGIGPEKMVGIYLERSTEMVIAVLGVQKSGGAYVPMDPIYPPQRIGYMIEDSQLDVIITQQLLVDSLPEHKARLILVDDDQQQLAVQPESNLDPIGKPQSLVYVIFTSGSTGRPKGVQISHQALVNFLVSMQQQPGIQPGDVLASVTTLSFDIVGLELYIPLLNGAQLVMLNADTAADGTALANALAQHNVTILQATPTTWRLLVETGWEGNPALKMLCGGEAWPASLAKQLLKKGGQLWNMYGPTETTIWSSICQVKTEDSLLTIGRPIANTQTYILDTQLQPVPVGVIGTLYIGGDGLARGYLRRPDLTKEKFIQNPFIKESYIYNTGDLARYLSDGRIECLGRSDSQVKVRGFRIELGEIETVLNEHPDIQQSVVIVREDTPGDKRLVAYNLLKSENTIKTRKLRSYLREKLPSYMIPSAYVFLENFPLTPNGKIDRRALPTPTETSGEVANITQPPTTPTEQLIAEIWRDVLKTEQIGIYDNFFDLGGHSLLAVQVVAELEERTGHRLEPAYLRIESLGQLAVTLENELTHNP